MAERALGAAVVAHETQHYEDRDILNSDDKTYRKEWRAYRPQNEVMMRLRVDGNGYSHFALYDDAVVRQAVTSCEADLTGGGESGGSSHYTPGEAEYKCTNH